MLAKGKSSFQALDDKNVRRRFRAYKKNDALLTFVKTIKGEFSKWRHLTAYFFAI